METNALNSFTADKESTADKAGNEHRPVKIFIPNLVARWPWPRRINPHYDAVKNESASWIAGFGAFSPEEQRAIDFCDPSLLACMAFPTAKKEYARASCDLMHLFRFNDDYSDVAEPSEVRKQKNILMDALRNPHNPRPKGEWLCGEMARQFWELTIRTASKQFQKRFIAVFDEYLEGVLQQAIDRSGHCIRGITSYFDVRRKTIATTASFAMIELALDIPDEIISHHTIQEMVLAATDMIIITNDIVSYNVEQSRGDDDHNIVKIVMLEFGVDVNGAILWAQDLYTKTEQSFFTAMAALPKWDEPLDSQVKEYCDGLGSWVRANCDWSIESRRYFGDRGREIREKGWMNLMPKKRKNGTVQARRLT